MRCLGTIITEEDLTETDELVTGPGRDIANREWFSRTYADKLVDMAVYYKFDGWFINIESNLQGGEAQVKQMYAFLAYFRSQIHARIPGGELIWYDSVISSSGVVDWQNVLNQNNYKFFEQSDGKIVVTLIVQGFKASCLLSGPSTIFVYLGIFINYFWGSQSVAQSSTLAGSRNRDVYTGIDVWGRKPLPYSFVDHHQTSLRSSIELFFSVQHVYTLRTYVWRRHVHRLQGP